MKLTRPNRALRLACAALLFALGGMPIADARDLFWQGRRDRLWEHGVDQNSGLSNWYSQPVGGTALRSPNGGDDAFFAHGAQQTDVRITEDHTEISALRIQPNDHRYTFWVDTFFTILGDGVRNADSANPPRFMIKTDGILQLRNHAQMLATHEGQSAKVRLARAGVLRFEDHSNGGSAGVANDGGIVEFLDLASAHQMRIENLPQLAGEGSHIRFYDRSNGGSAHFVNGANGLLDFVNTLGPLGGGVVNAGIIENDGTLSIGVRGLVIRDTFSQRSLGVLHIDRDGDLHGVLDIQGKANLGGKLLVLGFFGAPPGTYTLLHAAGGIKGKFTDVDAFGGRIAYGSKRIVLIVDPPPAQR
jgi:hypothetical protein